MLYEGNFIKNTYKNKQKHPMKSKVLLQKAKIYIKNNYLCKKVDFFTAKVYNYAYRMNIFSKSFALVYGGNKNG